MISNQGGSVARASHIVTKEEMEEAEEAEEEEAEEAEAEAEVHHLQPQEEETQTIGAMAQS